MASGYSYAQVVITGNATMRITGNIHTNINRSLDVESGATIQMRDSSITSVAGDFQNSANITATDSEFILDGDGDQEFSGATTFHDFSVTKQSGNVNFVNGSNITVEDFNLNSVADGILNMRDSAVISINGNTTRTGLGHVNGTIAQLIATGDDSNQLIPIGMGTDYVPVEFDINGTGGTQGYVEFYAEALDQNVAPSTISRTQVVERQWILSAGTGFDLNNREYDLLINYLNPDDIRNGADPDTFIVARKTTQQWVLPDVGTKTTSSVEGLDNDSLGIFIVGPEAEYLTFYSREDGVFSDGQNWSLYDFGSFPAPYAPRTQDSVLIGDSDTITLDQNVSTVADRGIFLVEGGSGNTTGSLFTESFEINGTGIFSMVGGSTLGIGSDDGITTAPTATGNIQTATRDYNLGSHNDGIFIYNSANTTGLSLGNGLPATVQDLIIRSASGGAYDLSSNITITDDFLVESGGIDIQANNVNGGDVFDVASDARAVVGGTNDLTAISGFTSYQLDQNSIIEFDGTNQTISNVPANFDNVIGFGNVWVRNSGIAQVSDPTLIRGELYNYAGAQINNSGINASLTVYECFTNFGAVTNSAAIYIGETP